MVMLSAAAALASPGAGEPKTIFDQASRSWAVGTFSLGKPLSFRDGRVLAFPSQFGEVLWAKQGKPQTLMLVYEVPADEVDKPFYQYKDVIFAPVQLLPEHSFWRDNLPPTPRHAIAGGRRNVFRGDDIAEARRVLGLYVQAMSVKGKERWSAEIDAVAQALSSSLPRLVEDAVAYLSASARLETDFPDSAKEPVSRYLEGPRPDAEKTLLIDALGRAKVSAMREELQKLAAGTGPVAAAAMVALDQMGAGASLERLFALSKSPNDDVRAYAGGRLADDRSGKTDTFERALELLDASQPSAVRRSVVKGFGWPGNSRAVEPLRALLMKGDAVSPPAAEALAIIGGEEAGKALKEALTTGPTEAAAASVNPLRSIQGCKDCGRVLLEQLKKHPDPRIRDLINLALELAKPHTH